ncbi:MAG: dTDP-4-dehydrorhamnose reductase [Nitrospirota bacterium]
MKYLITGKKGQLAQAFIHRFDASSIDYVAPEESQLDITDEKAVAHAVGFYKPDVILNCAAYNFVDKAELEKDTAFQVNAVGPRNLARAAQQFHARLVHFGSDYVFDGKKESGLYQEQDIPNPINTYGKTKLAGEEVVSQELDHCLIFRLSWVFGAGKQNFIHKFLEWTQKNSFVRIACDEFSAPTYTETVVDATLKAVETGLSGRYHLTNTGYCSRYEWARLITKILGITTFIRPVANEVFNLPAPRPKFSAMSNEQASKQLCMTIPDWEESVRSFLTQKVL